jgi:adenylosuccinate lyase
MPLLDGFAAELGLRAPDIPWLTARDRVAEFVCVLASGAGTVGKIGNEVYQLQRPEIGELREGAVDGAVGSITMPHKRNPEISEHLVTLSRVARAQAELALEGMVSEHERDGRAWKTEWVLLPEACLAGAASAALGARMLGALVVDSDRMRRNIEAQQGYPLSEPVLRALSERVGKHTAQEIVYEAAMAGLDRGEHFRTALRADPRLDVLDDAALDRLLDVANALGSATAFVRRVRRRCGVAP